MRSLRWRRRAARTCGVVSVVAASASVVLVAALTAGPVGAIGVAAGSARVVVPRDGSAASGTPLTAGDLATPFSLALPPGAGCPGDSTNDGFRVQSFMVRAGIDPGELTFGAAGPLPKGRGDALRQPLYEPNTAAYANAATDVAAAPGGPGAIINIPTFSLALLEPGDLPPGGYVVGLACTKGPAEVGQVASYWSATLELGDVAGGGRSWSAPIARDATGGAPGADVATSGSPEAAPPPADDASEPTRPSSQLPAEPDHAASTLASSASGAPPSWRVPAADLVADLSITGSATPSLAVWIAVAVVAARVARLLSRRPITTPI